MEDNFLKNKMLSQEAPAEESKSSVQETISPTLQAATILTPEEIEIKQLEKLVDNPKSINHGKHNI